MTQDWKKLLVAAAEVYGEGLTPSRVAVYAETLRAIPPDAVCAALREILADSKVTRFPTPAQIGDAAARLGAKSKKAFFEALPPCRDCGNLGLGFREDEKGRTFTEPCGCARGDFQRRESGGAFALPAEPTRSVRQISGRERAVGDRGDE